MKTIKNNLTNTLKKVAIFAATLTTSSVSLHAQNVGIGATSFTPDPHAMLEIQSTNKGLLIPRMTDLQRIAIAPTIGSDYGLMVYQTNTVSASNSAGYWYWDGAVWVRSNSSSGWALTGNAGTSASTNFIGTTDLTDFVMKSNNGERARITAAGNFGIGTTTPAATLSIGTGIISKLNISGLNGDVTFTDQQGSLTFPSVSGISAPMIQMFASGSANSARMVIAHSAGFSNWGIQYEDANDRFNFTPDGGVSNYLSVGMSSGRVGIGTNVPGGKFHVLNAVTGQPGAIVHTSNVSNSNDGLQVLHNGTGIGIYCNTSGVNAAGILSVQGNVWPFSPWFYNALVPQTVNTGNGVGVQAGGKNVGVEGCAMDDGITTTDQLGGVFYVRNSGSGLPAAAAIGCIVDNVIFKVIGFGLVSTIVKDTQENPVVMAAPESPEALFQDFGTGQLVNGFAHIAIDPILAKNIKVDAKHPLKVFVQLKDDCNGVFVSNSEGTGFDVRELKGGNSNATFSWSLTATRKNETRGSVTSDYENFRFKRTNNPAFNDVKTPISPANQNGSSDEIK